MVGFLESTPPKRVVGVRKQIDLAAVGFTILTDANQHLDSGRIKGKANQPRRRYFHYTYWPLFRPICIEAACIGINKRSIIQYNASQLQKLLQTILLVKLSSARPCQGYRDGTRR